MVEWRRTHLKSDRVSILGQPLDMAHQQLDLVEGGGGGGGDSEGGGGGDGEDEGGGVGGG